MTEHLTNKKRKATVSPEDSAESPPLRAVLNPIVEELVGIREAMEQANDIRLARLSPQERYFYQSERDKRHQEKAKLTQSHKTNTNEAA